MDFRLRSSKPIRWDEGVGVERRRIPKRETGIQGSWCGFRTEIYG